MYYRKLSIFASEWPPVCLHNHNYYLKVLHVTSMYMYSSSNISVRTLLTNPEMFVILLTSYKKPRYYIEHVTCTLILECYYDVVKRCVQPGLKVIN